jgi:hypothetical protein
MARVTPPSVCLRSLLLRDVAEFRWGVSLDAPNVEDFQPLVCLSHFELDWLVDHEFIADDSLDVEEHVSALPSHDEPEAATIVEPSDDALLNYALLQWPHSVESRCRWSQRYGTGCYGPIALLVEFRLIRARRLAECMGPISSGDGEIGKFRE